MTLDAAEAAAKRWQCWNRVYMLVLSESFTCVSAAEWVVGEAIVSAEARVAAARHPTSHLRRPNVVQAPKFTHHATGRETEG